MKRFAWLRGKVHEARARGIPAHYWLIILACSSPGNEYEKEAAGAARLLRAVFHE